MQLVQYDEDLKQVRFLCPGCGDLHVLNTDPKKGRPCWTFNRDLGRPTLSPSILARVFAVDGVTVRSVCHSYVTLGQIQFLGDSTHSLAGQTVKLEAIQ